MTREELLAICPNLDDVTPRQLVETWDVLQMMWGALYERSQAEQTEGKPIDENNIKLRRALNMGAICTHAVQNIIEGLEE